MYPRLLTELQKQDVVLAELAEDHEFPLFNGRQAVESQRKSGVRRGPLARPSTTPRLPLPRFVVSEVLCKLLDCSSLLTALCQNSLSTITAPTARRLLEMAGQLPLLGERLLVVSEFPQDAVYMPEVEILVVRLWVFLGQFCFFACNIFMLEKVDHDGALHPNATRRSVKSLGQFLVGVLRRVRLNDDSDLFIGPFPPESFRAINTRLVPQFVPEVPFLDRYDLCFSVSRPAGFFFRVLTGVARPKHHPSLGMPRSARYSYVAW